MKKKPIERVIAEVGSQKRLAEILGVSSGLIHLWVKGINPVTATRCIAIEQACNGRVTRYELRPDVFGGKAA